MEDSFGPMMEAARIQSEINRLFDNLLEVGGDETAGAWMPTADILENEDIRRLRLFVTGWIGLGLCRMIDENS